MYRIQVHTGSLDPVERCRPYVCKSNLSEMFDSDDIPTACDVVLVPRRSGQRPPNSVATKVRIPIDFANRGVDYQKDNGKWHRREVMTISADDALRDARVPTGLYWFWLEVD